MANINGTILDDILAGLPENDTITAGAGNDVLYGLGGADRLYGEDGNDTLNGGAGVDQLYGGAGSDVFTFSNLTDSTRTGGAMDNIHDFVKGEDKIDLSGLGFTGVTADGAGVGELKIEYNSFYNQTYVKDTHGTDFGFIVQGNHTDLNISDFTLDNAIYGTPAADKITGTAGSDVVWALDSNDTVNGGMGNDHLNGQAGADRLYGEDGNDTLNGGAGVDQLYGGAGSDVFTFSNLTDSTRTGGAMDNIHDFVKGEDKIDLSGLGFTGVTTGAAAAGELSVSYNSFYDHTYVVDTHGTDFGFYMAGNHANVDAGDFVF